MKRIKLYLITSVAICLLNFSFAQNVNWKNLDRSQKHILNLNAGLDNSTVIGICYGYHPSTKLPVIFSIEYSMPFGNKIFDDFKTKIGGQFNLVRANNFFATLKAYGIIRRYQNDYATMFNFGSEFSATAGIYKNRWFMAPEIGFDKAITTHVKHSSQMKLYNPQLQSGWYIPTGGNFSYGLQGGYSFRRSDVYIKLGKTVAQDFKTSPLLPFYFQLGWNQRW